MLPVLPFLLMILVFISLLLVALMVIAGADSIVEYARGRFSLRLATTEVPASRVVLSNGIQRIEGYALPESLFYHKGHTWVSPLDGETALVGLDEFAGKLIGTPTHIEMPDAGKSLKQGEKGWAFGRKGRQLNVDSPVDGEVIALNSRLFERPDLLSKDPYGAGWLAKIKTKKPIRDLGYLLYGSYARQWMQEAAAELRILFSGKVGMVYQDGGLPLDGLADYIELEDWNRFTERVFKTQNSAR